MSDYRPEQVLLGILLDGSHTNHGEILDAILDKVDLFIDGRAGLAVKAFASLFHRNGKVPAFFDLPDEARRIDRQWFERVENRSDDLSSFLRASVEFGDLSANYQHYIELLRDDIAKRRLQQLRATDYGFILPGDEIIQMREELERIEAGLYVPEKRRFIDQFSKTIGSILDQSGNQAAGFPTGYQAIDRMMGGIRKNDYVVIAARPSVGKTAFAWELAMSFMNAGAPVSFYSYDMSEDQFTFRVLSYFSGLDVVEIATKNFNPDTKDPWKKLNFAQNELIRLPFYAEFRHLELPALLRSIRDDVNKRRVKAVFIDYIQIVPWDRYDDEGRQVSAVSKALKKLGRELDVAMLPLSQLRRLQPGSQIPRPTLQDLRFSGQLEQDASAVFLLHRPLKQEGVPQLAMDGEIHLAKQQNGKTGMARARIGKGFRWTESIVNYEVGHGGSDDEE